MKMTLEDFYASVNVKTTVEVYDNSDSYSKDGAYAFVLGGNMALKAYIKPEIAALYVREMKAIGPDLIKCFVTDFGMDNFLL